MCTGPLVGTVVGCGENRPECGSSGSAACGGACSRTRASGDQQSFGISAGSAYDKGDGYCCGGTLGGIVQRTTGGKRRYYALSNAHVFAPEGAGPQVGQAQIMPSLIDTTPTCGSSDQFASLSDWVDLRSAGSSSVMVDGAIAELEWDNAVYNLMFGAHPQFNNMNPQPRAAALNAKVKKHGRTSGFTRGIITGVGAQVSVAYTFECGGSGTYTVNFRDQIIVEGTGGSFSRGGDSGSVVVEDIGTQPRPVGLLFAGNGQITVLNPMDTVLDRFGVTFIDGGEFSGSSSAINASTTLAAEQLGVRSAKQLRHVLDASAHDTNLADLERRSDVYGHYVGADPKTGDACVYVLVNNTAYLDGIAPKVIQDDVMVMYQNSAPLVALSKCQ